MAVSMCPFMFAHRTNWNLAENRLTVALTKARATRHRIADLTVSNPTSCGLNYDTATTLNALTDVHAMLYSPDPKGLYSARQSVVKYYAALGVPIDLEQLFLNTGTSEAYSFIFRMLCNPGDELLIPTPSYPLFEFLADIHDIRLVRYPLLYDHGWQIDTNAFERGISSRTRGAVIVNPNNPTGNYANEDAIWLTRTCAQKEIALIADEVFFDYSLSPGPRYTFAAASEALTFVLSGISKICGLPQMKAAWTIVKGPQNLRKEAIGRLEVIADTYLSMNAPVQYALPAFLEQRYEFQRQLSYRVRTNLAELDRQLTFSKNCSRLKVEGGWNVVIRVPALRSDDDTAIELLESKNVYVHPGHFYDFPGDGYLVVSLIVPIDEFADGIMKLLSIF